MSHSDPSSKVPSVASLFQRFSPRDNGGGNSDRRDGITSTDDRRDNGSLSRLETLRRSIAGASLRSMGKKPDDGSQSISRADDEGILVDRARDASGFSILKNNQVINDDLLMNDDYGNTPGVDNRSVTFGKAGEMGSYVDIDEVGSRSTLESLLGKISNPSTTPDEPLVIKKGESDNKPIKDSPLPMMVTTRGKMKMDNQPTYRLYMVPYDQSEYDNTCFKPQRQGTTFCTRRNCRLQHSISEKANLRPGDLYIMDKSYIFGFPSITSAILKDEVLQQWMTSEFPIEKWNQLFDAVAEVEDNSDLNKKISVTEIHQTESNIDVSLNFQTPKGKRKFTQLEDFGVNNFDQLVNDKDIKFEDQRLFSIIVGLEQRINLIANAIGTIKEVIVEEAQSTTHMSRTVDLRIKSIRDMIGTKPPNIHSGLNTPNIWSSLAALHDNMVSNNYISSDELKVLKESIQHRYDSKLTEQRNTMLQRFIDHDRKHQEHIKSLESSLYKVCEKLHIQQTRYVDRLNKMEEVVSSNWNKSAPEDNQTQTNENMEVMVQEIIELKDKIDVIQNAGDELYVNYQGIILHNHIDACNWIDVNMSDGTFEVLVDFHGSMQHIFKSLTDINVVDSLTKMAKISVKNVHQAVVMSSFETAIPRFFTNGSTAKISELVVDDSTSYFNAIPNYAVWKKPYSGLKVILEKQVMTFNKAMTTHIKNNVKMNSPLYHLATSAVNTSVTWILTLSKFICDTYNEYVNATFGEKKAWHIATRLATKMILLISKPRDSVWSAFSGDGPVAIAKIIFVPTLKSLELMEKTLSDGFISCEGISSELVKFIAQNIDFTAMTKLTEEAVTWRRTTDELKKEVKEVSKKADTASNKVDQQKDNSKSQYDRLDKRIKKLESS